MLASSPCRTRARAAARSRDKHLPRTLSDIDITVEHPLHKALRELGVHLGLSTVSLEQLAEAQQIAPVVCVRNFYNIANRADERPADPGHLVGSLRENIAGNGRRAVHHPVPVHIRIVNDRSST